MDIHLNKHQKKTPKTIHVQMKTPMEPTSLNMYNVLGDCIGLWDNRGGLGN
ncbi:hypothetical protein GDO81_006182 [Engystomops pustulosus]|uniref:Uncharacterized protein n=1 Tax=Engystomops pustulosus TaxID=76066 RepID=A0AAV7CWN0_ENGPU|nr:hypothetical protein GDO81_006182 [Engystomops pustulosus]KAG8588966.1 hypothetical protein GDO81_006182 [Engystomops pustulosus]